MDEPQQRHTYDYNQNSEDAYSDDYKDYQPRTSAPINGLGSNLI